MKKASGLFCKTARLLFGLLKRKGVDFGVSLGFEDEVGLEEWLINGRDVYLMYFSRAVSK